MAAIFQEADRSSFLSALAGLSGEEREEAVRSCFDSRINATMREATRGSWIRHAPERTLSKILGAMTKDDLLGLGRRMRLSGLSKLKKAELVERMLPGLARMAESPIEVLGGSVYVGALELGRRVCAAGGVLEMDAAAHDELPAAEWFRMIPPILFVFEHAGKVSCVMPDEAMARVGAADWETAIVARERIDRARHFVEAYTYQCGIVAMDELAGLYACYYPDGLTREEFDRFLLEDGPDPVTRFDYWTYKGVRHLVCYELVDEREAIGGFADIDGDRIARPSGTELFRRHLFERHAQVEIWEVLGNTAAAIEGYFFEKGLAELPSYRALQDFLDRHIPDGENDLAFANGVMRDLVEMARFEYSVPEIIDAIQDWGLILDSAPKTGRMLNLVMDFLNDIPIWGNNGWSPAQLHAREMGAGVGGEGADGNKSGKRVFYDETGKPRKVGRNEPCPCGSGKKYKRCCGR